MLVDAMESFYYLLHPRPVYLIATGTMERANLMAASWVMPVSEEPPRIAAALEKTTYTRSLIAETGYFTVNVVSADMVDAVWKAGTMSGRKVDKAKLLRLELAPARKHPVPFVKDALGYVLARVHDRVDVGETELVIADVIEAMAKEQYFDPRRGWMVLKAGILLHNAGRTFATVGRLVYPSR